MRAHHRDDGMNRFQSLMLFPQLRLDPLLIADQMAQQKIGPTQTDDQAGDERNQATTNTQ